MDIIQALFIFCCFIILYPYIIYPLLLKLIRHPLQKGGAGIVHYPAISVIISAYNEEAIIGRKIENTLTLDYPRNQLQIIVVSDQSTDSTDDIVRSYGKDGVILLSQPLRLGKTAGLNEAMDLAQGDIIVFSDADSMYEVNALKIIAETLESNERIGLVTGFTQYQSEKGGTLKVTTSIYTKLEIFIKKCETRLGSCVGADGAIFGMKRELYSRLNNDDINDLVIPLQVVKKGYRVVFDERLFCTEAPSFNEAGEFSRQIRITNRTLRAIFRHKDLMNIFRFPLFSFQLISHKLLRFCVPLCLLLVLPLNVALLRSSIIFYFMLAAQIGVYILCLLYLVSMHKEKRIAPLGFLFHFIMINLSMLIGWGQYISGKKNITWTPPPQ